MIAGTGYRRAGTLLGVALRAQPIDAACAGQPFVDVGLAFEALDVAVFGAWIFGDNLPVTFGNPFGLENDSGRFAHPALCGCYAGKSTSSRSWLGRPLGIRLRLHDDRR